MPFFLVLKLLFTPASDIMEISVAKLELGRHLRSQARAWEREDSVRQAERGVRIGVRKLELGDE